MLLTRWLHSLNNRLHTRRAATGKTRRGQRRPHPSVALETLEDRVMLSASNLPHELLRDGSGPGTIDIFFTGASHSDASSDAHTAVQTNTSVGLSIKFTPHASKQPAIFPARTLRIHNDSDGGGTDEWFDLLGSP